MLKFEPATNGFNFFGTEGYAFKSCAEHQKNCSIVDFQLHHRIYAIFYGHYKKFKDKYICEFYPIPVIDTDGVGDIGFNINECFYEGYFSKEKLIGFDLDILKDVGYFSIYGENEYLVDIYNSEMDCDDIKSLINDSSESKIAINFAFKYKDLTKIINILLKLTKML